MQRSTPFTACIIAREESFERLGINIDRALGPFYSEILLNLDRSNYSDWIKMYGQLLIFNM